MMMSLLLPMSLSVQAPGGLETLITYSQPAKSVAAVFEDLSKTAHVELSASQEATKEVVLISVDGLPLKSLMDKIAYVTACKWDHSGSKYTLEPAVATRNKEEADENARRIAKVREDVQGMLAKLKKDESAPKTDKSGGADAAAEAMAFMGGDSKTITLLLQDLDPAQLAMVQDGARGVWATNNPTQVQIPMTGETGQLITNWVAEHNAGIPKVDDANKALTDATGEGTASLPKYFQDMIKAKTTPVTGSVSKAILIAKRMAFGDTVQLQLVAFSSDGKVLLTADSTLGTGLADELKNMAEAKKPDLGGAKKSTPIEFSADSKELRQVGGGRMTPNPTGGKMTPGFKAKFLHPEINDPLSFEASDIYLAVAKSRNRQLVADLPDSTFGSYGIMAFGHPQINTLEEANAGITNRDSVQAVDDGQFLFLRPARPAEARLHRQNRFALRALIATSETKSMPSLDDIADYAVVNEEPTHNAVALAYLSNFCPGVMMNGMMAGGNLGWGLYRVFGNLDPTQRQTLRTGGSIPFSSLTSGQASVVASYLYGPDSSIQEDGTKTGQDMFTRMMSQFMNTGTDYRNEPTEVMPTGLPMAGTLSCNPTMEPIAVFHDDGGIYTNMSLGPQELALFKMFSKNPAAQALKLPKTGQLGVRQRLSLTFHVAPKLSSVGELLDCSLEKGATSVDLSALPSDFEAQVQSELTALEKSSVGSMLKMGMGPKDAVPPL